MKKRKKEPALNYSAELKKGQFILKLLNPVMALVNNLSYVLICLVGLYFINR